MPPLLFESSLPPEECQRRLEAVTEPDRLLADFKVGEGVLSRLGDQGFRLRLRRPHIRNSFSRLLYGRYQTTPSGSLIEVRLRLHPFVRVFTVFWFGFIILWTVLLLVLTVADHLSGGCVLDASPWLGFLVAGVQIVFGVLLFRSGRADGNELITFMQRALEATPVRQRVA